MLTYLAIAARLRPRWIVWENVPGVLSSNGGRDFGTFLGALGELGYGFAYRVLDAQYVRVGRWPRAVPQRRRRVFVVGRLIERGAGDWTAAAEVLALEEGLRRHLEAQSKKGKNAPSDAEGGARGGCWWDGGQVSQTLDAVLSKGQTMPEKNRFPAVLQPTAYRWQNDRDGLQQDDAVAALRASAGSSGFHEMNHPVVMAHAFYSTGGTHGVNQHPEVSPAVKVGSGLGIPSPPAVARAMTVRRLTARECERLQAFPDDYTLIPWRKKQAEDCPDGPRYKALGNSMAVNCMSWIGERIAKWEAEHER
jgi:DNA (cytosine-5)-methyltransferase 1